MIGSQYYQERDRSGRFVGFGVAIALHVVGIALVLQFQPIRSAITEAVPIMVRFITPPSPVVESLQELPRPLPAKPRLLPVKPRTAPVEPVPEPSPLITAAATTDAPSLLAASAPEAVSAPPAPAPVAAAPAGPVAVPVVPPGFDAAYLNNPPPAYPADSRRRGQQGKVVLRVLVNAGGTPDKVEIRTSSGFDRLDDAALEAIKRWRFVPAQQGNSPVAAWVLVPIRFTLEG